MLKEHSSPGSACPQNATLPFPQREGFFPLQNAKSPQILPYKLFFFFSFLFFSFLFFSYTGEYRLCSVSLKFFPSTMLSNVSPKCMNQFWSNLVTMTNDIARRCPMTLDPGQRSFKVTRVKYQYFLKNFSTQLGYVVWSHDSCTW